MTKTLPVNVSNMETDRGNQLMRHISEILEEMGIAPDGDGDSQPHTSARRWPPRPSGERTPYIKLVWVNEKADRAEALPASAPQPRVLNPV